MQSRIKDGLFQGVDTQAVLYYLLLVLAGCVCITAATYTDTEGTSFSDFSHFYIKQYTWFACVIPIALVVLLIDAKFYHMMAYPFYIFGILAMLATFTPLGKSVNGAKAWIGLGPFPIQPIEFVKIATALSLARIMSTYSFSIARIKDLLRIALLIGLPMILTILQNDTGSGVVMGAFLFVLYREGLNKWLCIPILFVAALFIISFLLTPTTLLILLILLCVLCEAMMNGHWRSRIVYLATTFLIATLLYILWVLHSPDTCSFFSALLWVSLLSIPVVLAYIYRTRLTNILFMVSLFIGAILFMQASDYLLNSKLRDHQQKRILSYLGVINDPANIDFNVNQSKIAIGSGRFIGKGFLNGTQNKYGFLPEKHTDFIFCTVGEEWGFVGATFILCVMCLLLLKLMQMGERQEETFGRVYCYSVAAILLFHIMVNVGMTIGLVPVMGIPLPFMSYGGSSLLAFTILLFIAIRLDAATNQFSLS